MRKLALVALLLLLLASAAAAQRGGMRGGFSGFGGRGISHGFGRGGFVHRGHSFGLGVRNFGFNRFHNFHRGFFHRGFRGGSFGFAWPVYVGGYYAPPYYGDSGYYPYSYYAPEPSVTVINPYPAEPQPAVIVNQSMAPLPRVRVYETAPAAENSGPPIYLLAFRDGIIRAALAYWTAGGEVRWLSTDHKQQSAPVEKLDRDLSERLNRERRVPFRLAPPLR